MNLISRTAGAERLIGLYTQNNEGPLIIMMGGIHGNEPAGVKALHNVFRILLEKRPIMKGIMTGVIGNFKAFSAKKRFIDTDLNRQWTLENVQRIEAANEYDLTMAEDREQKALLNLFNRIKGRFHQRFKHQPIILVDFHTFSAKGKAYSIATQTGESRHYASLLNIPVILGLEKVLKGTTLHYFNDLRMTAFCIETGQHDAPRSIAITEAAIWKSLEVMGIMKKSDIPDFERHEALLEEQLTGLPHIVDFVYRHPVEPEDGFKMLPGYINFQSIKEGELLAYDKNGPVYAPSDGMILMPLYQTQGEDGFFIVEEAKKDVKLSEPVQL